MEWWIDGVIDGSGNQKAVRVIAAERDAATDQPSMLLGDIVRCDQASGTRKIKGLDK
jgi:hypothetical protein